jgi:hypothetical protein
MKDFTKLKGYNDLSEFEQDNLKETYQAILDGKIYADVVSVSRSGLSRRIKFYQVVKYNNYTAIARSTVYVAWLTGWIDCGKYQQGKKYLIEEGLTVYGCGMDMIFHTLYDALGYDTAKDWNQQYNRL